MIDILSNFEHKMEFISIQDVVPFYKGLQKDSQPPSNHGGFLAGDPQWLFRVQTSERPLRHQPKSTS